MKLIGQGAFTRAYQKDKKTVVLHSIDPIKECMSLWFPESPLFPDIKRINYLDDGTGIYEMEYYPKVKSLKNALSDSQWGIYQDLRRIFEKERYDTPNNPNMFFYYWHEKFNSIKNKRVRKLMKEALDACGNYGTDICFEISPRNVAVKNGKLILIDCFYLYSKLDEVRSK